MSFEVRVFPGNATASSVRAAWAETIAAAREPGTPERAVLDQAGDNPELAESLRVQVCEEAHDFGATFLITVLGAVAAHVLNELWDDFVRPRLRHEHVDVGERVEGE